MPQPQRTTPAFSRRQMLATSGLGFGSLALAGLLQENGLLAANRSSSLQPRNSHGRPKARAVIQLFQNGGPSQMDMFDPKPELTKQAGKELPLEWERTNSTSNRNVLMATPFKFQKHGQSGMEFSEVVPHLSSIVDELCLIRSMYTEHNNHPFGINMFQTGKVLGGFPAMGSWICYALGTENQNLPGYIVLRDPQGYNTSGKMVWSSGWLPAVYQGTELSTLGSPFPNMTPTRSRPAQAQQRHLNLLNEFNQEHRQQHPHNTELEARIENFELAARMQLATGNILDISDETSETRDLYGLDDPLTAGYGMRCLLARRLVESGVRFIQVHPPVDDSFQPWDHHGDLEQRMRKICSMVDRPSMALIVDLLRRGLLDEVLVIWAGEFGRLPITQGEAGRDHNRQAFSIFTAGGGFKGGHIHGATDDFGYASVDDRVSCADLHATLLNQLGIDHTQLSYHHGGRDERLTDPEVTGARVLHELVS